MRIRCKPSRKTTTLPFGILTVLWILASVPTVCRSAAAGSSIARIELRDNAQEFLFARQRVDKGQRTFTPDRQRQDSSREQHGVADRQNRQGFRHNVFFISHCLKPPSQPKKQQMQSAELFALRH